MKLITFVALAGAPLLFAATAFAVDLGSEINNAQTHAGLAAQATDINGVHMHMHHALNCLVGPQGDGFDAKQMNPCAQSGGGAIPDEMDAAKKTKLMAAKADLSKGLAENDIAAAKADATSASTAIGTAK
jgi:hypothetical protein